MEMMELRNKASAARPLFFWALLRFHAESGIGFACPSITDSENLGARTTEPTRGLLVCKAGLGSLEGRFRVVMGQVFQGGCSQVRASHWGR